MSRSPSRRPAETGLAAQAQANTIENFKLVFDPKFMDTAIGRMDASDDSPRRQGRQTR